MLWAKAYGGSTGSRPLRYTREEFALSDLLPLKNECPANI
ncbi:hypothetical protein BH11ARM2_BH11ARM2_22290 [soil metagenome]